MRKQEQNSHKESFFFRNFYLKKGGRINLRYVVRPIRKGSIKEQEGDMKTSGLTCIVLLAGVAAAEVSVTDLVASLRPGTKLVDITYGVSSTETNAVTVSLLASSNKEAVAATSVTGDIGEGVATGPGKQIVWDGGADWNGQVGTVTFTVTANDGTSQAEATAPVARTGQVVSYREGDDGDRKTGAAWPVPRFTDNGDGTVTDLLTGLEWVKDPHSLAGNAGVRLWDGTVDFCYNLDFAGHSDWRLPNVKELESLLQNGTGLPFVWLNSEETPFSGIVGGFYWSATVCADNTGSSWRFNMDSGVIEKMGKMSSFCYTWPVRGGQDHADETIPAPVPKTGQTATLREGDDGHFKVGEVWPSPRFTDQLDGTVLDHLTGLEWAKTPHGLTGNDDSILWENAVDFCRSLDLADRSGWRLPTRRELISLLDYGLHSPALPGDHPFSGVQLNSYWSGTTRAGYTNQAWTVNMINGISTYSAKTNTLYVWPVRGNPTEGNSAFASADADLDLRDYYALTVTGGSGSGSCIYQQQIPIAASAPIVGKEFDRWTGDTDYVADAMSSSTTVTMPAQAVSLTATYKDIYYALTVTGGSGSGSCIYQQQVPIAAGAPPVGKIFDRWTGDTEYAVDASSPTTVVTMPAQPVTLTAIYKPVDPYTQPVSEWVVYDGKLQSQILRSTELDKPVIRKQTESLLLVMNTKKTATNGLLVVWSKAAGTNYVSDALLTVYAGSGKIKKENPVAAKNVVSLVLHVNGRSGLVLLGTSTWTGTYNAAGDMTREKLSVSFSGQTLKWFRTDDPGGESFSDADDAEGYGAASLRYNQSLSDAMNAEAADIGKILSDYMARKTSRVGIPAELVERIR